MGSQLSARIRREADEAHSRRREMERLYKFSQKLLGEGNVIQFDECHSELYRGEFRGWRRLSCSFRRREKSSNRSGMAPPI